MLPDGAIDFQGASGEAAFQLARNSDGTVSLYRQGMGWVSAFPGGPLRAQAPVVDDWERFELSEQKNHTVALGIGGRVVCRAPAPRRGPQAILKCIWHGEWASSRDLF